MHSTLRLNQIAREALFILFAIYYAQGSLYISGSYISQVSLILIILISIFYFIKALLIEKENSLFYYSWTSLLLLNIIGFIFSGDYSDNDQFHMFKGILGCMLTFFPFYYFAQFTDLKSSHLIRFFLIMLPIIILRFYSNRNQILIDSGSDIADVVNNLSYSFLSFLPFVFLIRKHRILAGALLAILIFFLIQGAKRGAIVGGFVGLIMYFYYQFNTYRRETLFANNLITLVIIGFLSVLAVRFTISNEFVMYRLSSIIEGNTSNRNLIYEMIFDKWYNNQNLLHYLFGFGFAASLDITGAYAHNDWLELLSNFGILGIGIYLLFFYAAFKTSFKRNWQKDKQILLFTITLIWLLITFISKRYSSFEGYSQAILFGYLIGDKNNDIV